MDMKVRIALLFFNDSDEAERVFHELKAAAIYKNVMLSMVRSRSGGYRVILTIPDRTCIAADVAFV